MIHTENTVRTLQAVAMVVGLSVFLWSTGLPTLFRFAEAASITSASDTLSNSAPGVVSDHAIAFTTPNGMLANADFTITFASQFDTAAIALGDVDLSVGGSDQSLQSGASGSGVWGVSGLGTDAITFQAPSNAGIASSSAVVVKIGLNASGGTNRITNPSATTSYAIDIAGTMQDSGQVRVAIVDQVTVSASVDTSLTFSVTGVNSGQGVNGTSTNVTSTATTIPFGTLAIGGIKTLAHDLSVITNAKNGFTVTVQQTGLLQSSTGATIDGFSNGLNTVTPISWQPPSATINDEKTYGHWGITSQDYATFARGGNEFSSNAWVSGSTTAPIVVFGHDDPADGSTDNIGDTRVGYQIEISALQEAGDDYSTTLRYVATPTF